MPPRPNHVMGRFLQHVGRQWLRENGEAGRNQLARGVGVSGATITNLLNSEAPGAGADLEEGFARLLGIEGWELKKRASEFDRKHPPTDPARIERELRRVLEGRARLRSHRFVAADVELAARTAISAGADEGQLADEAADRLLEHAAGLREAAERLFSKSGDDETTHSDHSNIRVSPAHRKPAVEVPDDEKATVEIPHLKRRRTTPRPRG